ncbi:MAG: NAD+ synthase [Dehalococcoidia bacterium]|nr:MAG: NAD+ synthase [Dehalococcoidia bacterium]
MKQLRLALAQINPTVGDLLDNIRLITANIEKAREQGAHIVAFPELAVCGYPPEDLLLKPGFIKANQKALEQIISTVHGITAVVGFVDSKPEGLYNAAAIIQDGKVTGIYHKRHLPNYGVFDEARYFQPGGSCPVFNIAGIKIGINVCEDIWKDNGPVTNQVSAGAEVILNISASPYHQGKYAVRERLIKSWAIDSGTVVAFCNMTGGQDELVFDGASLIVDRHGHTIARAKQFQEELLVVDINIGNTIESKEWQVADLLTSEAEFYQALQLGTRDYVLKNGFKGVIIGLSGGVDSSIVAAVAADALGPESVHGLIMPSRFSSPLSAEYAEKLAANLGIKTFTIPIEGSYLAYLDSLSDVFAGVEPDVTEENLQARIRGNLLMAMSNKFGWLVLNTGNKSEVATGYTTLYGDMAGGFAVIKDVPKTMVYKLCRHRNAVAGSDIIPAGVITRVPSAELRPDQKDSDNLPLYELLDPILLSYVEEDRSVEQIVAQGYDVAVVKRIAKLVDSSEYKRRQAPPGIKITPKAFGRDRRLPITNKFRGS